MRFKYGIHTIYVFVDSLGTMSGVTEELLHLLRERYPSGLTKSISSPERTLMPEGDVRLAYGVLNVSNDPNKGWKRISIGQEGVYTPVKAGLKDNGIVAIQFVDKEHEVDGEVEFDVDWPREEDAYEQQRA